MEGDAPIAPSPEGEAGIARALRTQVLSALRELVAGFERANRACGGRLLPAGEIVYPALVTVVLRIVFVLFAEDKGLLPVGSEPYSSTYSLSHLHARLRADHARYGSAMEGRYGAWGRAVALFRLLHGGAGGAGDELVPPRGGALFDPDTYPFLEGRIQGAPSAPPRAPEIPDGALLRVLDLLRIADGAELSYADLSVEHIGSAYEGLMGFEVHTASALSLTLQPDDVVVDMTSLSARDASERLRFLKDVVGLSVKGKLAERVKHASGPAELCSALRKKASPRCPDPIEEGSLFLQPGEERRRFGAHYTSRALTRVVVERALRPLLSNEMTAEQVLSLKVCDPAMGSGAFLVEACRQLAERLSRAWERASAPLSLPSGDDRLSYAKRLVATRCLYGIDKNPLAVELSKLSLWIETSARAHPFTFVDHALRQGDSLLGLSKEQIACGSLSLGRGLAENRLRAIVDERIREARRSREEVVSPNGPPGANPQKNKLDAADKHVRELRLIGDLLVAAVFEAEQKKGRRAERVAGDLSGTALRILSGDRILSAETRALEVRARHAPFHFPIELPEVFEERGGFDAIVGNPPWVSYAGRASQPLAAELRSFYLATSEAFAGYRNLQGIFVEKSCGLLRPGGRLGLVLPTSMSDLAGYEPSRRAHDTLSVCDCDLPDFGDAFDAVFQPSMGLLSTRRAQPVIDGKAGPWPLQRSDLDPIDHALFARLSGLPKLPGHLFGERGFQTMGAEVHKLRELSSPEGRYSTGLRVGGDIGPFLLRAPSFHCDPSEFEGRLRPPSDYKAVKLLIRQTARYPIVTLSDGVAFRNSLLAGFEDDAHSAEFLLAYLNSTPIRWFHYVCHRDARQGMPQMKIGHLRALPDLAPGAIGRAEIEQIGALLGARNSGIDEAEQARLDALVARALGVDDRALERMRAWAASLVG